MISAPGGSYGPGVPDHGMDHLLPTLETAMGPQTLGIELHTASIAASHAEAGPLARALAS